MYSGIPLYYIEMIIAIVPYVLPMEKREKGWKAAGVLTLFMLLLYGGMQLVLTWLFGSSSGDTVNENAAYYMLWFLLIWAGAILQIKVLCKVKRSELIYVFSLGYASEHLSYCIRNLVEGISGGMVGNHEPVLYISAHLGVALLTYVWFSRKTIYKGHYLIDQVSAVGASVAIIFVVCGLSLVSQSRGFLYIHSLYAMLVVCLILMTQRGQMIREIERIEFQQREQLWEKNRLQYQISKDSMAVVNQHYHDLKHQIRALADMTDNDKKKAYLSEMEENIAAYDAVLHTGNEHLDTVLTEKKLICHNRGIQLSCIADGQAVAFMDEIDLYTLLGNALDNAIEANEGLGPDSHRWISLQIQKRKGLLLIEIANPYHGSLQMTPDGSIKTSKQDAESHGYGVKSIKSIVEKYKGQMTIHTENQRFLLRMVF